MLSGDCGSLIHLAIAFPPEYQTVPVLFGATRNAGSHLLSFTQGEELLTRLKNVLCLGLTFQDQLVLAAEAKLGTRQRGGIRYPPPQIWARIPSMYFLVTPGSPLNGGSTGRKKISSHLYEVKLPGTEPQCPLAIRSPTCWGV